MGGGRRRQGPGPTGDASVERILDGAPPEVRRLANAVRRTLHGMIDGVSEIAHPGWRAIGFHRRGLFAHLTAREDHVRVSFEHGYALPDLGGLLEGDGSQVRWISIRSEDELGTFAVRGLLSAALFDDDTHGFRRRAKKRT